MASVQAAPTGLQLGQERFGAMPDGRPVTLYTLSNPSGVRVKVMPLGATIVSVETPDRSGHAANITLGFETFEPYLKPTVFGAVIGRYANRIAGASFTIDGATYPLAVNSGTNHIHGGKVGFNRVLWTAEPRQDGSVVGVVLRYESRDGEEGYPGNLSATVQYTLSADNELSMIYEATTDKPTHVNLTNHAYWNLSGGQAKDVLAHELMINADASLRADAAKIPLGEPVTVENTPMDFRQPQAIGARIETVPGGYDHCYVLRKKSDEELSLAARVFEPGSGRVMDVYTTQPGVQLYTDNGRGHRALCLETQHYPDSPHHPNYPSTLLRPGEKYRQVTVHRFSVR